MAEGDITFYNLGKEKIADQDLDWEGATTVKMMLVASHTPNIDTHEFIDDVSGDEVSDASYTAGGNAITSRAIAVDTANDRVDFTAANLTFSALDVGTPSHGVVYVDTGTPSTSPVIFYIELGTTASNGGDYTIDWSGSGLVATLS